VVVDSITFFYIFEIMKIKKEFIGHTIYKGRVKIHLGEVVTEATMKRLILEYPQFLQEDKPKKKKKDVTLD
tara:strand:- start:2444 stop:2656 length:213 start_codon:yes stop_codon:yes gene_type:complete